MADEQHLKIINQGVWAWNRWRVYHVDVLPDLREADLKDADLSEANLSKANLIEADLSRANLSNAFLSGADLSEAILNSANLSHASLGGADLTSAHLNEADLSHASLSDAILVNADLISANLCYASLSGANLCYARLIGADLSRANLRLANLTGADLSRANLTGADLFAADLSQTRFIEADLSGAELIAATLVETNFSHANLIECKVYGISAWSLRLEGAKQKSLIITRENEPTITVDDLEVAQFIYLLLNNKKIRQVIDTVTSKVVLLLGRFTEERKAVLDAIREELRKRNYLPVLFDFDKPTSKDVHETVTTLARLARFIIADITDPKSIPQELVSIVEQLPSLPVQPLLQRGSEPWGMYDHIARYPWVLGLHYYDGLADLLTSLDEKVIAPAVAKAKELKP
jgi:uncharacterized protein YjbI with pentapeptide repeats